MAGTDVAEKVDRNRALDEQRDTGEGLPAVVSAPSSAAPGSMKTETAANELRHLRQAKAALAVSLRKTQ